MKVLKSINSLFCLFFLVIACTNHSEKQKAELIEDNRFTKITIAEGLEEPYELAISKDNRVFFIQRHGKIELYNPKTNDIEQVGSIPVHTGFEDGLVGITLDPNFIENGWVYMFYSPLGDVAEYRLSRFKFDGDSILKSSEKIMLRIPSQREDCCHTGGSLAFDSKGNLFLSVGDNTTPFQANGGYAPLDERPGSVSRDDQRTAANSNDLRGKILRITPQKDGTYTIPEGNLFPKDGSQGRPEIYIMGDRNPFRISVDQKTSWLYWGEIGPDAGEDSELGPRGYDEINQARKAGNFGWPYFIADNKPYAMYDFATNKIGPKQDPMHPVNNSVNNTGTKTLPPAQKAFIYYPYVPSKEFPIVGEGGRSAMAGPVYHYDMYPETQVKFPKAMDKVFFGYDWMRDWILAIRTKPNGDLDTIENHFKHLWFAHPMDVEFGPDGSMYVLEYGYKWWGFDNTTKFSRIIYDRGNRTPIASISINDSVGPNQFKVYFSSKGTKDPDNDKLRYEWRFTEGDVQSREANPTFTFINPGIYYPTLTVTDPKGKSSTVTTKIVVGNRLPKIDILTEGNQSFYWDGVPLPYKVIAEDREDGKIKNSQLVLSFKYLNEGEDMAGLLGHQVQKKDDNQINHPLINKSDCKACHQMKDKSVGPSFYDIAIRYKNDKGAVDKLAAKVIKGGAGSWGNHAMSAHPQVPLSDGKEMVRYILSVIGDKKPSDILQSEGVLTFKEHLTNEGKGKYFFTASYTDKGIGKLTGYGQLKLRNPVVKPDEADFKNQLHLWGSNGIVEARSPNTYFGFKNLDLTDISNINVQYTSKLEKSTIELHLDSAKGKLVASGNLQLSSNWDDWHIASLNLNNVSGKHDLYFVYKNGGIEKHNMLIVKRLYFNNQKAKPLKMVVEAKK
ncbi:MAG: PQQ-dependent sugar dehydrogenase [Bacteroidota bacterium]|nr:PQQ-dependent sugar dehydrogenase [Bacteroidota bacterium]